MLAKERKKATSIAAEGLSRKVAELYQEGKLQGMIAIGGITGTFYLFFNDVEGFLSLIQHTNNNDTHPSSPS